MINEKVLNEFAKLAVQIGTNIQKGQPLYIRGPIEAYEFIRKCVRVAYEAGASEVLVDYSDNVRTRMNYEYVETDLLKEVPEWSVMKTKYGIERGIAQLSIVSPDPDMLEGIDPNKIKEVQMAGMQAMRPFMYYTMNNVGQWSIVAYPNTVWAKKVFPELNEEEALAKLWDAILYASRVNEDGDVVDAWNKHNAEVQAHSKKMNDLNFKSLHFKNGLGTDLVVGLVENHVWEGGCDKASNGAIFNPNIPTEEVFTMPDRFNINGTVVSTKPLSYGGKLIDGFSLTFKDGKVVAYSAKENEETLKNMLETDDGAVSLGEVALISHDSPISNLNILFYNTLFDENASCHLALGRCYPSNIKGGTEMSEEELMAKGGNQSMIHVDFMFGSADMSVVGTTHDGKEVVVFENGNFVI